MVRYCIRQAIPADAPRIIHAINVVGAEGGYLYTSRYIPTPQWEAALHCPDSVPDHLLLIAEQDGVLIGVARLFPCDAAPGGDTTGELGLVVVDHLRGRGVGTALIREILHRALTLGYVRIVLSVRRANERAVRLYRRFGFEVESVQWREYAFLGEQEELRMALTLNPGGFGGRPMTLLPLVQRQPTSADEESLELPLFAPDVVTTLAAVVVSLDQHGQTGPACLEGGPGVDSDCACE